MEASFIRYLIPLKLNIIFFRIIFEATLLTVAEGQNCSLDRPECFDKARAPTLNFVRSSCYMYKLSIFAYHICIYMILQVD